MEIVPVIRAVDSTCGHLLCVKEEMVWHTVLKRFSSLLVTWEKQYKQTCDGVIEAWGRSM